MTSDPSLVERRVELEPLTANLQVGKCSVPPQPPSPTASWLPLSLINTWGSSLALTSCPCHLTPPASLQCHRARLSPADFLFSDPEKSHSPQTFLL